jgi:hypothetical protein
MAGILARRTWMVVLVAAARLVPAACGAAEASPGPFKVRPYLQNASPDAITIVWQARDAAAPGTATVEYGRHSDQPGYPDKATGPARDSIRKVRITGLQAGTCYDYRVREQDAVATGTFTTAPASTDHVRFAVLGDSRFWGEAWEHSRYPEHLLANGPEFLLHMGDLVSKGSDATTWPPHFRRFESLTGGLCLFPIRGNHEGDPRSKPGETDWFTRYFDLPGGEPLSSFDWGNIHFSLITFTATREGPDLLAADLAKTTRPWKVVLFHYPVYTTGYYDYADSRRSEGTPAFEAVCDRFKVDLMLTAHTHIYERCFAMRAGRRDDRNGTVYLVQGGDVGGNFPARWTARLVTEMDRPHYTLIDIRNDVMELRTFGLAPGDGKKGRDARIHEVDRYIRWHDEARPRQALAELEAASGPARLSLIRELGAMVYAPAAPSLTKLLADPDENIRRAAALALEDIADPLTASALLPDLKHPDEEVREHLARAIEKAMPVELAGEVKTLVLDPGLSPKVRAKLLGALVLHAPDSAKEPALKCLQEADGDLRARAADAIRRTAVRADVPLLIGLFEREQDEFVAGSLATALNRLTGAEVVVKRVLNAKATERAELINMWRKALK